MGLVESLRQLVTGGPETKTTETNRFLPGNGSSEQQIHDYCKEAASQTENNRFKQAIELVRQRIQLMYTSLLEKIGVADLSKQFGFLLAAQVMMYLLGRLLLLSKKEPLISPQLVKAIKNQLGVEVKVISTKDRKYQLPAELLGENVVCLVAVASAGKDNHHFAIRVYFRKREEPIHTEFRISPNKQDEGLATEIVNAIKRAIRNLNDSPGLAGTKPKMADNSGKKKPNRQNRGRK